MEMQRFGQALGSVPFFHRLLLKLPPEVSHAIAIEFLKRQRAAQVWGSTTNVRSQPFELSPLPGLKFKNRLGMAAGFDKNAEVVAGLEALGFGFVEVGTVTPRPQPGNPKPRIWRCPGETLVNALGFNNCGGEVFLSHLRAQVRSIPVFANIGKNKDTPNEAAIEDYRFLFGLLGSDVDGFVINVSSPNTPGLRSLQSVEFLKALAGIAPAKLPTFVKLAPDLSDKELRDLAGFVASEAKFRGLVLTNTSRNLAEQREKRSVGGLSGPPLFERTCSAVALARPILGKNKIIIAVGGIDSLKRAKTLRELGADLVEIYTAFIYHGPKMVRDLSGC